MKANIALNLFKKSYYALLALLNNVIAKMTGNPLFANPAISVADMQLQSGRLTKAIEAATNGGQDERMARDKEVLLTREMLRVQADYVRTVCAGDALKLVSSGFELARQRTPVGQVKAPAIQYVRMTGDRGQVEVRWTKERGADTYNVLMTKQDPASNAVTWEIVGSTTRTRFYYGGLESLTRYWFAVRAVGSAGESVMSEPAIGVAA